MRITLLLLVSLFQLNSFATETISFAITVSGTNRNTVIIIGNATPIQVRPTARAPLASGNIYVDNEENLQNRSVFNTDAFNLFFSTSLYFVI